MNREDIKVIIGLIDRRIRESNLQLTAGSGGIASFLLHTKLRDMPSAVVADHDGRYYTETELGSVQVGEGASLIGIQDAGGYYSSINVEDALQEIIASGIVTSLAKLGDGTLFGGDVKLIEGSGITIIRDDANHGFEFISAGGGITDIEIQEDDVKVADVTIINFEGDGGKVTDEGGGKVTVDITPGVGGGSEVAGCHGISYSINNQAINEGNTYTSGDLRDGTYVPSDAEGLWMMLLGTPSAASKVLACDSADDVPDLYSSRVRSQVVAPIEWLVMVRLGTGANAGKVKIKAISGNWTGIYAWPVGYWK